MANVRYHLGVDLGTTFSALAVARNGTAEIVSLGHRSQIAPSVVLVRPDGTTLTGEAAERRAFNEPDCVAREFKRRIGDPAPYLLAGRPFSAEALSARLLRALVDQVSEREGGRPTGIAVTHPANWGAYRREQLQQVVRLSEVGDVVTLTEPEAAAISYASAARVAPGAVVAVYDLGGGTFDAAILRKTDDGFEMLGEPEGIERLGGIDFDAAVWAFVNRALGGALERLDPFDPAQVTAAARLRADCIDAKETLSVDTVADIPVILPGAQSVVQITRPDFEELIQPALEESVAAMRRSLRSAGLEPEQLDAVVLVGGSSRIPLVGQTIAAELGTPIALDAHPKHAIALGAALWCALRNGAVASPARAAGIVPPGPAAPSPSAAPPADAPVGVAAAAVAAEPSAPEAPPAAPTLPPMASAAVSSGGIGAHDLIDPGSAAQAPATDAAQWDRAASLDEQPTPEPPAPAAASATPVAPAAEAVEAPPPPLAPGERVIPDFSGAKPAKPPKSEKPPKAEKPPRAEKPPKAEKEPRPPKPPKTPKQARRAAEAAPSSTGPDVAAAAERAPSGDRTVAYLAIGLVAVALIAVVVLFIAYGGG